MPVNAVNKCRDTLKCHRQHPVGGRTVFMPGLDRKKVRRFMSRSRPPQHAQAKENSLLTFD